MKIDLGLNPKYTKYILISAGALLLLVVVIWLWKKFRTVASDDSHGKIIKTIEENNLTYELPQYEAWANSLEVYFQDKGLFSGGLAGVNESGIYAVMENMKTNDDVKQLIKAFGKRHMRKEYSLYSEDYALEQAMAHFLSTKELKKVNSILESNNVTFKFN